MTKTKKSDQQLIVQALNAAETNIRLAKQLLSGIKAGPPKPSPKDLPGITGTFDGENMITEEGKKYTVNPNYASKSVLVYGDTLKRVEVDGQERFKQIARVKRHKVEGILAKKAGKWTAVTADGSYKVSPVAVEFYKGEEGDEAVVVIPVEDKNAPYAALESVKKDLPTGKAGEVVEEKPSKPSEPSKPSLVSAVKKAVRKAPARKNAPTKKRVVTKKKAEKEEPEKEIKPAPEPVVEAEAEGEGDEELR